MDGFGLWTSGGEGGDAAPVALTGVRMTARVTAVGQQTTVEQVFVNKEARPIEAVYTFPLPAGAAVRGFEAITGDRVLIGEIEELSKGIEQYDQAVQDGHGAFMAEVWRPDVFSTRLGNLKPGQAVLIRLTYVADVDLAGRKLRLDFPTTLAPRYATATGMDLSDALTEADALNPPHVLAVPYGLELSVTIDLGLKLRSVASPTHGLRVEPLADSGAWRASLAADRTAMNKNVVIEAELAKEAGAGAWTEPGAEGGETFAAVTFLPEFDATELAAPAPRDVVFVLDCSGSMGGTSIDQAKRALALCLKCLNEGDRFNICRFGSTFELMKPEPVAYSQKTLDAAIAYLGGVDANLGGTELHAPLEAVLRASNPRQPRDIILLTDGQVTNEPALVRLAGAFRGKARVFTFGIGPASSQYLVKGLARATDGAADFIAPGERIEDKVLRMFGRLASPRLEEIEVDWHGAEADMEPRQPSALFDGEPLRVAARLRGAAPRQVTLRARWHGQHKEWAVPVTDTPRDAAGVIAPLWTRARLAALEGAADDSAASHAERQHTAVALSKRYHVLGKETTLIAVEHRSLEERTKGLPALRRVPVLLAEGWGGVMAVGASVMLKCVAAPAGKRVSAPADEKLMKDATAISRVQESRKWFESTAHPASPAPAAKFAEPHDTLHDLLLLQSAEGSFASSPLFTTTPLNGVTWDPAAVRKDVEALSIPAAARDRVVATALALAALATCFAGQRDLWTMAAQKATRWLAKIAPAVKAWADARIPTS
jgi:Ca-activated chloride channel family protein